MEYIIRGGGGGGINLHVHQTRTCTLYDYTERGTCTSEYIGKQVMISENYGKGRGIFLKHVHQSGDF